jgi:hypothetical protein
MVSIIIIENTKNNQISMFGFSVSINTTTKGVPVCQVISLDFGWIHWS